MKKKYFFALFLTIAFINVYSQNTIQPYNGPFGKSQLQHLLRRTLFGCTIDDLKYFEGKSMNQVVDEILNTNPTADPPTWSFQYSYNDSTSFKAGKTWLGTSGQFARTESIIQNNISYWWHYLMMTQDRTIREKMVLFYENFVPSNNGKNLEAQGLYYYNRVKLLREYATGNYKEFMKKITLEPSMMFYLDMNNSFVYNWYSIYAKLPLSPTKPNENYARELQELYTVGKGRNNNEQLFTEEDVKAAANVLSGWCVCNNNDPSYKKFLCKDTLSYQVAYNDTLHSSKDKVFSSFYNNIVISAKKGPNGGIEEINTLIDMLFDRKESSENLVRKLYRFFVYSYISDDAENTVIQPLAKMCSEGGNGYQPYDLKPILKALLTSAHFYDKEQIGCMIKNPYDFVVGMSRMLDVKTYNLNEIRLYPDSVFNNLTANQIGNYIAVLAHRQSQYIRGLCFGSGMVVSSVPDVAGYPAYYQSPDFHHLWINADYLRRRKEAIHYDFQPPNGWFVGILTMSDSLFEINSNTQPLICSFASRLNNQENIDDFIQQNIDYFLVKDLPNADKEKLKFILNETNSISWLNAWNSYKSNKNNFVNVYHKLRLFYESLFSYAEFQLM